MCRDKVFNFYQDIEWTKQKTDGMYMNRHHETHFHQIAENDPLDVELCQISLLLWCYHTIIHISKYIIVHRYDPRFVFFCLSIHLFFAIDISRWTYYVFYLLKSSGFTLPVRENRTITRISMNFKKFQEVHEANMGPTWDLSAQDGPHVGPMNLAIRVCINPVVRPNSKCFMISLCIRLSKVESNTSLGNVYFIIKPVFTHET